MSRPPAQAEQAQSRGLMLARFPSGAAGSFATFSTNRMGALLPDGQSSPVPSRVSGNPLVMARPLTVTSQAVTGFYCVQIGGGVPGSPDGRSRRAVVPAVGVTTISHDLWVLPKALTLALFRVDSNALGLQTVGSPVSLESHDQVRWPRPGITSAGGRVRRVSQHGRGSAHHDPGPTAGWQERARRAMARKLRQPLGLL